LIAKGVDVTFENQLGHIDFYNDSESLDLTRDYLYLDAADGAEVALGYGRSSSIFQNMFEVASLLAQKQALQILPELDEEALTKQLLDQFGEKETPAVAADYLIELSDNEPIITFVPGSSGEELNTDSVISYLFKDASDLQISTPILELREIKIEMTEEDAMSLEEEIKITLQNTPFKLTYTAENTREYSWEITDEDLAEWLSPMYSSDEDYNEVTILILSGDSFEEFMSGVAEDVNEEPINARFVMEDGRVAEFAGSQSGVSLNTDGTMYSIIEALTASEKSAPIITDITEPEITTDAVNTLGITEILGVGVSDFSGSPRNRIANIQHGASKLNGLLIAPGETLSLLEHLRPFTIADGYLPELVILGDEIKPEVGGGLCQIGTTTFRAVMNSGLEVVDRRNHSLVVSYYDDPANGNPGTDATIYDPAPDFKFRNDTENYVLLTTEVDIANKELIFTLWGTSDGRKGYYSPPVILSWSGYGATQYTQTTSLAPGVKECQTPHPGATTSFDYTVEYADGEVFEKNYTSVYRSLPWICLIGVSNLSSECSDSGNCTFDSQEAAEASDQKIDILFDGTDTQEQTVGTPDDATTDESAVTESSTTENTTIEIVE